MTTPKKSVAEFIDHPYWRLRAAYFAGRGFRLTADEVDKIINSDNAVIGAIGSMEEEAIEAGYRLRRRIW